MKLAYRLGCVVLAGLLAAACGGAPADTVTKDDPLTASSPGIVGLFPTGVSAEGTALAAGSVDPHYVLSSDDPKFPGPNAIAVNPAGPRWVLVPDEDIAMWDSVAEGGGDGDVMQYTYTTTFTITNVNPTQVTVSGTYACDDECTVSLNGVQVASVGVPGWESVQTLSIPAGSPFNAGENTLTFAVQNKGGVSGLGVFTLFGKAPAAATVE